MDISKEVFKAAIFKDHDGHLLTTAVQLMDAIGAIADLVGACIFLVVVATVIQRFFGL